MKWLELRVPPLVVVIIVAALMWLFSQYYYFIRLVFSYQTPLAFAFVVLGFVVIGLGVWAFRRHHTTVNPVSPEQASDLVTTGIFRFSRNPMYLGMLLWLMALGIHFFTLTSWLCVPLFVIYMVKFQIKPEERILTEKFNSTYLAYTAKVRRWI